MGKLHELLSVEGDLEGTFKAILAETSHSFAKKPGLYFGFHKRLEMFDEGAPEPPAEVQEMTTTVMEKMRYAAGHIIRYLDAIYQKEATNQVAQADLVVDGQVIAAGLPATFLLGLEARLKKVRETVAAMPTLPFGKKWVVDTTRGEDVYRCETPDEKFKTAKTFRHKVLYEATEHHPAQIEKWEETENVGKYIVDTWSGMISSAQKSALLGRLDKLIQGAKKARQRANTEEVLKLHIGDALFKYLQI
ncbi:MAG: hypothetical protein P8Y45_14355 [Exilibacterium sp.]